jgi:hypothetical protein
MGYSWDINGIYRYKWCIYIWSINHLWDINGYDLWSIDIEWLKITSFQYKEISRNERMAHRGFVWVVHGIGVFTLCFASAVVILVTPHFFSTNASFIKPGLLGNLPFISLNDIYIYINDGLLMIYTNKWEIPHLLMISPLNPPPMVDFSLLCLNTRGYPCHWLAKPEPCSYSNNEGLGPRSTLSSCSKVHEYKFWLIYSYL